MPSYVLEYAPLVWLDEGEEYFPSDMFSQIENTEPEVNYIPVLEAPSPLTVHNLDLLNEYGRGGHDVFLTSELDITEDPNWLYGVIPDLRGRTRNVTSAAIITNDHGNGSLDAFYMYFYAYNKGNTILGDELGNHVGDWEHNMIRFVKGVPQAVWYSQHGNGQAFAYSAVEKAGPRPITYSARGSHANYAIGGIHDHLIPDLNLPNGFLRDYTSKGTLWDPLLSTYWYKYHDPSKSFSSASKGSPLGVMHYRGRWGDQQYPRSDPRQKDLFGFKKYVGGPTGPWNKQLNRAQVCPDNGLFCIVRTRLVP
ncbi:MAG: hypothetical protein M1818_008305 [Claussenomyces sp. TS43310]|nr:MAG: hypothetical protein M1818_008305 [Claussenomyces sp. TS43310]